MRKKIFINSIILFLSLFIIFVFCGKQDAEWKGTIEEVDGVTVVRNPQEPLYSEDVFSLEEELSIGKAEGREEYMFSLIAIDVDGHENIYILDKKSAQIRVFDKTGKHILSFGKKGQGH